MNLPWRWALGVGLAVGLAFSLCAGTGDDRSGDLSPAKGKSAQPPQKTLTPEQMREAYMKLLLTDKLNSLGAGVLAEQYRKLAAEQTAAAKRLKEEMGNKPDQAETNTYRYVTALADWYTKLAAAIDYYGKCKENEFLLTVYSDPARDQKLEQLKDYDKQARQDTRNLLVQKPKPPKD